MFLPFPPSISEVFAQLRTIPGSETLESHLMGSAVCCAVTLNLNHTETLYSTAGGVAHLVVVCSLDALLHQRPRNDAAIPVGGRPSLRDRIPQLALQ